MSVRRTRCGFSKCGVSCEQLLLTGEYVAVGVGVKHVLMFWNDTDPFTAKINLTYRYIFSPYHAVNTLLLCYKNQSVKAYREIIAVCSQIHTKHINTLCGQNVECRTYRAVNTLRLSYKNQPVNAVQ